MMLKTGLSKTAIKINLRKLKEKGIIKRIWSNKKGYWIVLEYL